MLQQYVPVLILLLVAAGFAGLVLALSGVMGPRGVSAAAEETYESGIVPEEPARQRFPVRFALVAMSFLIFDVEVVFFYPWAVVYRQLGLFGFGAMLLFIVVLLIGYIYEYKKGAFDWE